MLSGILSNNSVQQDELVQVLGRLLGHYGFNPHEVLDERLVKFIRQLPVSSAILVISEFENSLQSCADNIRNPAAYIMGVTKRLSESAGDKIRKLAVNEPIMGSNLTSNIMQRLHSLEYDGFCSMHDFSTECFEMLSIMSESEAMAAVDELQCSDRSRIKTISAFFASILKKYVRPPSSSLGTQRGERGSSLVPGEAYANYCSNLTVKQRTNAHKFHANPVTHKEPSQMMGIARSLPPAPDRMPLDLFYFNPLDEYCPSMPSPLDDKGLNPYVLDRCNQLVEAGMLTYADIDSRLVAELARNSPISGLIALNEFIMITDRGSIKSIPGYLLGIIKRLAKEQDDDKSNPRVNAAVVDRAMDEKIYSGIIGPHDLDPATRDYMRGLPEIVALQAIEEFCRKDIRTINNKSAYFKGVVRKLLETSSSSRR